ncbi:MAG: beta-Ala-His dipeptidase, partial [Chlorobi bacterium]|nr:beta-Ala-His dipeptidase [Chlorobiota bacterium]
MANALANIEPKEVWKNFEEICQYPHPSRKEDKLAAYIVSWAEKNNFTVEKDKTGNILISKPATPGMEDRQAIAIQGHIDMVCQKNSDTEFDFDNDAIQAYVDGDWVKAKGTTLGADNGIGVAMGMTIMESSDIPHPAFELLCTLDEETGLTGAMTLSDTFLKADILINLDSEEDGAFTIGCAGGINTDASFKYEADPVPTGMVAYEVAIKGLQGGHSGIEIHDGRANALKFLNRLLWTADKQFDFRLSTFEGGNAHNAIPREAFATIMVAKDHTAGFEAFIKDFDQKIKVEYKSKEAGIAAVCATTDMPCRV